MAHYRQLKIVGIAGLIAVLLTGLAMIGLAGEDDDQGHGIVQGEEEALQHDAQLYAAHFGVGIETARQNLGLQRLAGSLEVALVQRESETFAGQWVEHTPEFRVVVQFTDLSSDVISTVQSHIDDSPLEEIVDVRLADYTLTGLQEIQQSATETVRTVQDSSFDFDSYTNVMENRVEIRVTDREALVGRLATSGLSLPEAVTVTEVDSDSLIRITEGTERSLNDEPTELMPSPFQVPDAQASHTVYTRVS